MDRNQVIEKIQKLLALAGDQGATENEAAVAATKAQALLDNWNIEQWELGQRASTQTMVMKTVPFWAGSRVEWEVWLSTIVSRATNVTVLTDKKCITWVGEEVDVEVCDKIFQKVKVILGNLAYQRTQEFTVRIKERLGVSDARRLKGANHPRAFREAYLAGALSTLGKRIKEDQRARRSTETMTAIVLDKRARQEEFLKETFGGITWREGRQTYSNGEGMSMGAIDGNKIQWRDSIEG